MDRYVLVCYFEFFEISYLTSPKGLNGDPLDLVQRDFLLSAIVEHGGTRGGVVGDVLGGLEGAVVFEVGGDAGGGEAGVQIQLQVVMTGDGMLLAALLVQPQPAAAALQEVVPDPHAQDGADAGEGVDHGADQRPVAQANQQGFPQGLLGLGAGAVLPGADGPDAVEQGAGFLRCQHRRLAPLEGVFGAAHGVGRVHLEELAG